MGLGPNWSGEYDPPVTVDGLQKKQTGNPNPHNFRILTYWKSRNYLLLYVNYPDCKNYEGNKLLLFKTKDIQNIIQRVSIDPHFTQETDSPLARFAPTLEGVDLAMWYLSADNAGDI